MSLHVDVFYSSCACNTGSHNADWGRNGFILYGACNAVAVYDYKYGAGGKVLSTYCSHKGTVTSVRWVRDEGGQPETEFISTSVDGTAVVWTHGQDLKYHPSAVLAGHTDTVTAADGIYLSEKREALTVATCSMDNSIKIWRRSDKDGSFTNVETLNLDPETGWCVRLHFLPNSKEVLLVCASDSKVHLFAHETEVVVCSSEEKKVDSFAHETSKTRKVDTLVAHEDFVWTVDVTTTDSGDLLLATGSSDCTVRLWRVSPSKEPPKTKHSLNEMIQGIKRVFTVGGKHYYAESETVLRFHRSAVTGVCWDPDNSGGLKQPMKLLSSGMDKVAIIWELDQSLTKWQEIAQFGDIKAKAKIGFHGGKFGPDGLTVMIHGYQGFLQLWKYDKDSDAWLSLVPVGGHSAAVVDAQWEPDGAFLLSVGADKTTRVHGPWIHSDNLKCVTWHELARPQVHGHDMSCIAPLSRYTFASGAEEKVVRMFRATQVFHKNVSTICQLKSNDKNYEEELFPLGVSVPELGLTIKAVYNSEELEGDQHMDRDLDNPSESSSVISPLILGEPPREEHLHHRTLWPEMCKLYGHVFDVYCLAAHPSGKYLASASKASKQEHARIVIWNTQTFVLEQYLNSHVLTVTQMEFSPDGKYLLSVSRDRTWTLFKQCDQGDPFLWEAATNKENGVHSRIIWTCSWSHDSLYFATGSRDGKVAIWPSSSRPPVCCSRKEFVGQSVTAVAFSRSSFEQMYRIAIGFESGAISIYTWNPHSNEWKMLLELDNNTAHHLAVKRLSFRPGSNSLLASCGMDHFVKIYNLDS